MDRYKERRRVKGNERERRGRETKTEDRQTDKQTEIERQARKQAVGWID